MDQILEQVDGAVGIADDDKKKHDKIFYKVIQVAIENAESGPKVYLFMSWYSVKMALV